MGFGDGKGVELGDGEGEEGRKHGITLSSCTKYFTDFTERCTIQPVIYRWYIGISFSIPPFCE
jgi:hypothetical protein